MLLEYVILSISMSDCLMSEGQCVCVCVCACMLASMGRHVHACICIYIYIHVCLLHLFCLFFSQRSALSVHGDQIHCADCCHLPVLSLRGKTWAFVLGLIFA